MTREEAQIVIGNIPLNPEALDDCYSITDYQEAKAMAIKALEQEPIILKVNDKQLKGLKELIHDNPLCVAIAESKAEQDPKTGHWIDRQEGRWIYAKCSECGTIHDTQTNYCPNCGAKMIEPQESEGKK